MRAKDLDVGKESSNGEEQYKIALRHAPAVALSGQTELSRW